MIEDLLRKLNQATRRIDGVTAYSSDAFTPFLNYGDPFSKKTIYFTHLGIRPRGGEDITFGWQRDDRPEQMVSVNQQGGVPLDTFLLDTDILGGGRFVDVFQTVEGEFRSIAYRFQSSINASDMEIHKLSASIRLGAESTEN